MAVSNAVNLYQTPTINLSEQKRIAHQNKLQLFDDKLEPELNPKDIPIESQKQSGKDEKVQNDWEKDDDLSVGSYGLDVGIV